MTARNRNDKPAAIELLKIVGSDNSTRSRYNDSDEDTNQLRAPTTPVVVFVDSIRCYNARKNGQPGTRLTFKDGGGYAVAQPMDALKAAIGIEVLVVPMPEAETPSPVAEGTAETAIN